MSETRDARAHQEPGTSLRLPLTEVAAVAWRQWVHPGSFAIDATAGNGHDTCHLARLVGPAGHVFAIDIQAAALRNTRCQLQTHGLLDRVTLIEADHARLLEWIPGEYIGKISLACFNLGYLPGGDHGLVTRTATTLEGLRSAAKTLSPEGALSVVTYRGHPGAMEEHEAVEAFFACPEGEWTLHERRCTGTLRPGPVWRMVSR